MNYEKLSRIRLFLLDMDGTFYLGHKLLPGALEFIELLKSRETQYMFLTNNSSRSSKEYAEKIRQLGVDVSEDKIFTSGEATAIYLSRQNPRARIYLVGTPELAGEFERSGFRLVEREPDFVVLGFDTTLTYAKLWKMCDFVRSGIPYIATHPDANCPTDTGYMPDIGSIIAFVTTSTGRKPDIIIGKPYDPIVDAIVKKANLSVSAIAMIGDRLYTDVALGATGIMTILLLSGETRSADLKKSPYKPDYVMQNLSELTQILKNLPTSRSPSQN
jgi:HAD superfamily hydrolase (TIGR01457 family)